MNFDVFLLFLDIVLTMVCAAGIVLWILRREYLPEIRRLEREGRAGRNSGPADGAAPGEGE